MSAEHYPSGLTENAKAMANQNTSPEEMADRVLDFAENDPRPREEVTRAMKALARAASHDLYPDYPLDHLLPERVQEPPTPIDANQSRHEGGEDVEATDEPEDTLDHAVGF